MFRISILDSSANIFCSSYSNKNLGIWHSRLCHVNNEAIVRLSKMDLIPSYNYDKSHKCEVCTSKAVPQTVSLDRGEKHLTTLAHRRYKCRGEV